MTNQRCYVATDIPIKVGHIVVVKRGAAFGNKPGTITKVTKVKPYLPHAIVCEDCTNEPKHGNPNIEIKTPSYVEYANDVRLAYKEERSLYFERKRKYAELIKFESL